MWTRRVDGFAVHASIVSCEIIELEIGGDPYHRVGGEPAPPYAQASPSSSRRIASISSTIQARKRWTLLMFSLCGLARKR